MTRPLADVPSYGRDLAAPRPAKAKAPSWSLLFHEWLALGGIDPRGLSWDEMTRLITEYNRGYPRPRVRAS